MDLGIFSAVTQANDGVEIVIFQDRYAKPPEPDNVSEYAEGLQASEGEQELPARQFISRSLSLMDILFPIIKGVLSLLCSTWRIFACPTSPVLRTITETYPCTHWTPRSKTIYLLLRAIGQPIRNRWNMKRAPSIKAKPDSYR